MMNTPATKSDLVEIVTSARREWEALLAEVQPAEMELPALAGEWSLKDLVAHIAWFENQMVGMLTERALVGSDLWNLSQDERNQVVYLQNKDHPLDEVLSEARAIHARLMTLIEGLQDAELHDPTHFRYMPPDWQPWRIIADNTYLHYQDHSRDLQAWLAGKAVTY